MARDANVFEYAEIFGARRAEDAARVVAALRANRRISEAAEVQVGVLVALREQAVLAPGEPAPDPREAAHQLDELLEELPAASAGRVRAALETRLLRVERAEKRLAPDPEVLRPFRARVGRDLGRFLGSREPGPAKLPPRRTLAQEGGAAYVLVPRGQYSAGPPGGPARRVELEAFHIRTTLVTVASYGMFLEAESYPAHPLWGWKGFDRGDQPAVGVPWEAAAAYACWLGGRLPTEAEWIAAKAHGEGIELDHGLAWEMLLDDAGDPGGPMGPQGVILLGEGFAKCLRGPGGDRRELPAGRGRADTGFRLVLDPRM